MKKYYRQAIAFLLVWFCSGVTMYSYQAENKILGITFTFLSFLYWFIIDKDDYSIAKVERPLFQQEGVQQIWNLKIASSCDLIGFLVAYKRVKEE